LAPPPGVADGSKRGSTKPGAWVWPKLWPLAFVPRRAIGLSDGLGAALSGPEPSLGVRALADWLAELDAVGETDGPGKARKGAIPVPPLFALLDFLVLLVLLGPAAG